MEKVAKEKQQAEEAAKAFAAKTAAASAAAEKERQNAISAAAAAGQHQTVPDARNNLNQATAEASRLKTVADNALNTAKNKRKEAIDAVPVATQAEKKYQDLQQSIKGLTLNNNGQYGTQKWEVTVSGKGQNVGNNWMGGPVPGMVLLFLPRLRINYAGRFSVVLILPVGRSGKRLLTILH
ncbi:hypothetical protein [Klebsiella variicola]|uniref:hypothetical protein n=1 Tax=Klebsiella variicola TaxID=244366 RepID=UPI0027D97658|nr:hypothetical protein [Klebsiella variicola]